MTHRLGKGQPMQMMQTQDIKEETNESDVGRATKHQNDNFSKPEEQVEQRLAEEIKSCMENTLEPQKWPRKIFVCDKKQDSFHSGR